MKITGKAIKPVKQEDGTWDVIAEDYEEEIKDLGREHLMCNICGFGAYPECMNWCKAYLPQRAKSLGPAPLDKKDA